MKLDKDEIKKVIKSINGMKYMMHFVSGVNSRRLGNVLYFNDMSIPNLMRFYKADVFSPDDIYNWNFGQKCGCEKEDSKTFYDFTEYKQGFSKKPNFDLRRDIYSRNQLPGTPVTQYESIDNPEVKMKVLGCYTATELTFDDFLNQQEIADMQFDRNIKTVSGGNIEGNVIYTDDFVDVPINETKVFYYNPYGYITTRSDRMKCLHHKFDISDYLLVTNGIDPFRNKCMKKLVAFDLMKDLKNEGVDIVKQDNTYIIPNQKTVGKAVYQSWWDKAVKSIKKAGKKIEKSFTTPVREYLKKKSPAIWKVIDKIDKSVGMEKISKKWGKELENLGKKYGGKLMEYAVNYGTSMAASYVGVDPETAKQGLKVAINSYEKISDKEKNQMTNIIDTATYLQSPEVKNVYSELFSITERSMAEKEKDKKVLEKDANTLKSIFMDMVKEGQLITSQNAGDLISNTEKNLPNALLNLTNKQDFTNKPESIPNTTYQPKVEYQNQFAVSNQVPSFSSITNPKPVNALFGVNNRFFFEPYNQVVVKNTLGCIACLLL